MNYHEWLGALVSFDTTSRNSNLPLIKFIQGELKKLGIKARLTLDETKKKANLFATLPAGQNATADGVILSGHTDVVPVDGQAWDLDPFQATTINDRIYGRGTCDMKGFIAVILALIPEWQTRTLPNPIHIALTYDEEVGCHGGSRLISDLNKQRLRPRACIVGEPTNMQPVIAHKGIDVFRCRVHGLATHSSLTPSGCNAIEYAAKLISKLRDLADQFKINGPFDSYYDVPFSTMTTNVIEGGTAHNIIPSLCEFFFEVRHLPAVDSNALQQKIQSDISALKKIMQQEFSEANIEFDVLASVPAFQSSENAWIKGLLQKINSDNTIRKVSYATEAGLFEKAGISTIICGPGSIEQAHRANEYVTLDQLEQCEKFLRQVVDYV